MKKVSEIKITHEQLKNLSLLKIMIEENVYLLNFLVKKDIIKMNIEITNFKEKIDSLKNLIENVLFDKNVEILSSLDISEVNEMELNKELDDIKKIKNKSISKKYREILKDNLKIFFDILKKANIEDIAVMYNIKIYPIAEMEEIYKYI